MAQLDIAGIDPKRIEQVVTHRLVEIPTLPKVLALPIFGAVAAALYAGLAPLWMFLVPAAVYVVSVWGSWRVQVVYRRDPSAVSLASWRWLYTVTAVPTSFANGLMGGFFATLPAEEERALWALALCLIVGGTPSRGLDGRTYTLSAASLVLPMAGVLVLGDGSRHAIGLAAIMLGFVVIVSLFAHIERKRTRAEIARDLAAHDLSKSLDDAHRDVAFAEETMRTMLDNMSDGALLYEGDGRWVYQNKAMARLHDMPDEVLKGLPTFRDIIRHRALRGDYGPLETLPGGLEGWIASRARALQPAGPAGRAAAHHHRPHRRGDLPALARRPRAHRASRPHRHRRAGEPRSPRRSPSRSARAPPCARCSTTWATVPRSTRRTAGCCSTTPPSAACSTSMP